jgi:hypothetical protein
MQPDSAALGGGELDERSHRDPGCVECW